MSIAVISPLIVFLLATAWSCELTAAEPRDSPQPAQPADDQFFQATIVPLVEQYCVECHEGDSADAEVALDGLHSVEQILGHREKWERVYRQLGIDGMPPEDHDRRLSPDERNTLLKWFDQTLHHVDCELVDDAGRVTIHRLNRTEYNNTVRDLLGVDIKPAADFPSDDLGYGFSNIGDVLSLPPLLLEKYVDAAEKISAAVIQTTPLSQQAIRVSGDRLKSTGNASEEVAGFRLLYSEGSLYSEHEIGTAGEYVIRIEAAADQAGPELAKMEVRIDGKAVKVHEIRGHREPANYELSHRLEQGRHRIEAAFINDYYLPDAEQESDRDRNLGIRFIELQGPMDVSASEAHRRLICSEPTEENTLAQAANEIFVRLLPRAFRRPVDEFEVERMVKLVELATSQGDSFERAIQIGLQAVLVSPHFLFRVEYDADPINAQNQHELSDFELASRLSYFLWSTMPDDELFELARSGELHKRDVLDQQVGRMLDDPKANALVDNFASQWLTLGNLDEVKPDPKLFPEFTPELRADIVRETELFVKSIFREDRSLLDFLDADFTFLNERLAKHYGIDGVQGEEFRRVTLPGSQRVGVLTHASILTLTSNPNRTSLVRRGNWIVETILGIPLPDPPADVPSLEEGAKQSGATTMREQLKLHREMPACASCHNTLDPLGFGLENFDAIGRWRDQAEGVPVDAGGKLPGGKAFSGPAELAQILKERQLDFAELVTKKLLTYALGRGLTLPDSCAVDEIVSELQREDFRFSVLVRGIVHSKPFRMRRGEQEENKQ
ncbi:MAG: DUF1592 domain-containing protein [Planctomycetales bacterium]|nr:DUF1592 domain-containing protein [Planctomycetales bacterium]